MPFTSETALTGTQFKPGVSGNPKGLPKGYKHLSTWIQELLEDEDFEANILDAKLGIVSYKGAPIKALVGVNIARAINGDPKAAEWLAKYGYGSKVDVTTNGKDLPTPVLDLTAIQGD